MRYDVKCYTTLHYTMPYYTTPCSTIPDHTKLYYLVCHIVIHNTVSPHTTFFCNVLYTRLQCIMQCYIIHSSTITCASWYHTTPDYVILYDTVLCHVVLYYVRLHYAILDFNMLYFIVPDTILHAALCYTTSCDMMACHAILY